MISPDEQRLIKAIVLVAGLGVLYWYIAVMFIAGYRSAKGDKK